MKIYFCQMPYLTEDIGSGESNYLLNKKGENPYNILKIMVLPESIRGRVGKKLLLGGTTGAVCLKS